MKRGQCPKTRVLLENIYTTIMKPSHEHDTSTDDTRHDGGRGGMGGWLAVDAVEKWVQIDKIGLA